MKVLRSCVVGIGFIGAAHIEALHRLPNVEVVALAEQKGWRLIRTDNGVYGWCVANLIRDA